jgi:hypothetical protein
VVLCGSVTVLLLCGAHGCKRNLTNMCTYLAMVLCLTTFGDYLTSSGVK